MSDEPETVGDKTCPLSCHCRDKLNNNMEMIQLFLKMKKKSMIFRLHVTSTDQESQLFRS